MQRHLIYIGAFDPKVHELIGQTGNNQLIPKIYNSLHEFFQKTYGFLEPRATQVVRENIKSGFPRDNDKYVVDLSTLWTKGDMNKTFCYHIGWSVTSDTIFNI